MTTVACRRDGCTGLIEEGYCDACGLSTDRISSEAQGYDAAQCEAPLPVANGRLEPFPGAGPRPRRAASPERTSAQRKLGAGLVHLPELAAVDPETAVLLSTTVPEHKRFCGRCDAPVRRESGFCGQCGARYSFAATLQRGEVVADQYEVRGPLAFGGLGWIYLAFDRLLSRYVVLKGLLNTQDSAAAAAAVAERQFLASVKHPNIVGIYSFVQKGHEGFIVMEYVGGKTLRQLRDERGPLPAAEALAYVHRILPALGYLHRMGLVYCDFKPENVMLEYDDVKLIDLGGVRRMHDNTGDIFGTVGYSAPEAAEGITVASDLYTVGRALLMLLMDVPQFRRELRFRLPERASQPLLLQNDSLYRLLLKATAAEPDDRFFSAEEMAEQMFGVLRETVACESGQPRSGSSRLFGTDLLALDAGCEMDPVWPDPRYLPLPSIDGSDGGAQAVATAFSLPELSRRVAALRVALQSRAASREVRLRLAGVLTDVGETAEAEALLRGLWQENPWDWRVLWFSARVELRSYRPARARELFEQIAHDLPGELAPRLAAGFAAELAGDLQQAERLYDRVSRVDPAFVSAIFGLARCRQQAGDRQGAVEAFERMAPSAALYLRGRVQAVRALLCCEGRDARASLSEVVQAAEIASTLALRPEDRCELEREIYAAAVAGFSGADRRLKTALQLFGQPLSERNVRTGWEATLRRMAQGTHGARRLALIDEANRIRPRTMF